MLEPRLEALALHARIVLRERRERFVALLGEHGGEVSAWLGGRVWREGVMLHECGDGYDVYWLAPCFGIIGFKS